MASGDTLVVFRPYEAEAPSATFASLYSRGGHPVLRFDDSSDRFAVFSSILPRNYAAGGITVDLHWVAASATSGTCRWGAQIEAISALDIDAESFATAQTAAGTANATAGIETVTSIAFTNGAQMDSLAAGGAFRLRVYRDADGTSGTDDMSGNAELLMVEIRET